MKSVEKNNDSNKIILMLDSIEKHILKLENRVLSIENKLDRLIYTQKKESGGIPDFPPFNPHKPFNPLPKFDRF